MTLLFRIVPVLALLPVVSSWAMAPMGTGDKTDIVICGMTERNDSGPRHPCVVSWYQLVANRKVLDYRTIYRTDDDITGMAVGDLNGNGEHELILAVRGQRTGLSSIMVAAMDRMGTLKGKLRGITQAEDLCYTGLAFGDFDSDGLPDILALRSDSKNNNELVWLAIDDAGKVVSSKQLKTGKLRDAQAMTFGNLGQDGQIDVFVAVSSKKGSRIARLIYAAGRDGINLVGRQYIATISASLGEVHGLTIIENNGQTSLLAATRKLDTQAMGTELSLEMEHKGVFIAPLTTAEATDDDKSYFVLVPIDKRGKAQVQTTIDDLHAGRQWASSVAIIPTLPSSKAPATPPKPRRTNAPRKVLYLRGLLSHYFQVEALEHLGSDVTLVKRSLKRLKNLHIPQAAEFKNLADLVKYDAVILADVPIWALGYSQLLMLEPYVRSGGQLFVFEGPCSGRAGGYAESLLEDILPCKAGPAFATRKLAQPFELPGIDNADNGLQRSGYLYYHKLQGPPREDSVVLLNAGQVPILVERGLGHGRVVLFAGMPLGQDSDGKPGFWRCEGWPVYLKQMLFP